MAVKADKAKPTAAKPKTGTAVAAKPKGTVATINPEMFEQHAGAGLNFTKDDLALPFLRILQGNSPQVKKQNPAYVKGAEAGMYFNTITKELWDGEDGVLFIPVVYSMNMIEWKPDRGGFVKDHGNDPELLRSCKVSEDGKFKNLLPNGKELVPTMTYVGYVVDAETGKAELVTLPLSGSARTNARKWNNFMDSIRERKADGSGDFKPAIFYTVWRLKSEFAQNDQGDWMRFAEPERYGRTIDLPFGSKTYMDAVGFAGAVTKGEVKVNAADVEDAEFEEVEGDGDDTL